MTPADFRRFALGRPGAGARCLEALRASSDPARRTLAREIDVRIAAIRLQAINAEREGRPAAHLWRIVAHYTPAPAPEATTTGAAPLAPVVEFSTRPAS